MKEEILLVDDDRLLLKTLSSVLDQAGYAVRAVTNGEAALAAIRERRPDLVLMDVMMPKVDGIDACRRLREDDAALPVLFLTALDTPADEVKALAAGGDGYVAKTEPDEVLLARIAATLRTRTASAAEPGVFAFGPWRVDGKALTMCLSRERSVSITEREFYLLRLFAEHPNEVLTRDMLVTRLWRGAELPDDNGLSVLVYALRRKLGETAGAIRARRGVGYFYASACNGL